VLYEVGKEEKDMAYVFKNENKQMSSASMFNQLLYQRHAGFLKGF